MQATSTDSSRHRRASSSSSCRRSCVRDLPMRVDDSAFLCPAMSDKPVHTKKTGSPAYALASGAFAYIAPDRLVGDGILNESGCMMGSCADTCRVVSVNMCGHTMCTSCKDAAKSEGKGCALCHAAEVSAITEIGQQRIEQLRAPINMSAEVASDDGADEDVVPRGEQDAPGSPPEDGDSKGDDLDLFLESLSAEEMEKFTAEQAVKAIISSVRESVVKAMKIRSRPK